MAGAPIRQPVSLTNDDNVVTFVEKSWCRGSWKWILEVDPKVLDLEIGNDEK